MGEKGGEPMENSGRATGSKADAKDLLLHDYRYLSDSFARSEQLGETRVNLFIGVVTVVVGALVSMMTTEKLQVASNLRYLIVIGSLVSLLLFGVITLSRMLTRNRTSDLYKRGLDTVRQAFKDQYDRDGVLVNYYPVDWPETEKGKKTPRDSLREIQGLKRLWERIEKEPSTRRIGGLAHAVAALNSLLFATLAGTLLYGVPNRNETLHLVTISLGAVATLGVGFWAQHLYIIYCSVRAKDELRKGQYTHAGGVVRRLRNGVLEYLIVRPKEKSR
jgi:hypothetical protein